MTRYFTPVIAILSLSIAAGVQLRNGRTDCNDNGVPDELETGPLGGYALLFDGVDDCVDPGEAPALKDLSQGDFTLEAWVWTDNTVDRGVILGNLHDSGECWNFLVYYGGVIRLYMDDGENTSSCESSTVVADGAWHHVAAVRHAGGSGTIKIYVDGALDSVSLTNSVPFSVPHKTWIGRDARDNPLWMDGALNDLRVWDHERSGEEIATDMYDVLDGTEPGLVAYWRFDEGTGVVAHDSTGSFDGTLVGPPEWIEMGTDCNGNGVPDECEVLPTGVLYVDDDATGGLNDGSSWANAHLELSAALRHAECSDLISEIRVAGGTYKPGLARADSFCLQKGIALRGGYRGMAGGGNPNDRDIGAFESVLSGDIGVLGDKSDNSYRIVVMPLADGPPVLEGFTITGANNTEPSTQGYGGGVDAESRTQTIAHCKIIANDSLQDGAGVYISYECGATLIDCVFSNNASGDCGGGVYVENDANTTMINCTFNGNSAADCGGGAYVGEVGSVALINCAFSGNEAENGGGLCSELGNPTLTGCTFSNNSASHVGGGIWNGCDRNTVVRNCILWGNTAPEGPQIFDEDSTILVTYSCVQGAWSGEGNASSDPLFVDADGPDNTPGTLDDDLRLMAAISPYIDAGNNELVPADTFDLDGDGDTDERIPYDAGGNARLVDDARRPDTGLGEAPVVDMGAYESVSQTAGSADLDGDGDVDVDDFLLFQQQFNGPQP